MRVAIKLSETLKKQFITVNKGINNTANTKGGTDVIIIIIIIIIILIIIIFIDLYYAKINPGKEIFICALH